MVRMFPSSPSPLQYFFCTQLIVLLCNLVKSFYMCSICDSYVQLFSENGINIIKRKFEEMLIARAFPVMHVYTKPRGGQRAYKGHVLPLPQDVQQLADVLPRCPKDLPVIIFGKDNCSSDFVARRNKVEALYWLTGKNINGQPNKPLYKNVKIDKQTLANLPEHGILSDGTKAECGENAEEYWTSKFCR